MRITESQLRRIIREEVARANIREGERDDLLRLAMNAIDGVELNKGKEEESTWMGRLETKLMGMGFKDKGSEIFDMVKNGKYKEARQKLETDAKETSD